MTGWLGRPAAASCWALVALAVVAHAALAALAAAEYATMGWPLPTSYDTAAVTLVLATAAADLFTSQPVTVNVDRASCTWDPATAVV